MCSVRSFFSRWLLIALFWGGAPSEVGAFLPVSRVLVAPTLSFVNDRRIPFHGKSHINSDNATWEEEASQAVLSGQGDLSSLSSSRGGDATADDANYLSVLSPAKTLQSMTVGYRQRVAADPAFLSKSIIEIIVSASTQLVAELGRRGKQRMLLEIDFVVAGVLTATFGKYYSMWKTARTLDADAGDSKEKVSGSDDEPSSTTWREKVPNNAFQPTLFDGYTKPTLSSRFLAIILPMPNLFRAGVIASMFGYGSTWVLIQLRTLLIPEYVAATRNVSVPLAAIYTGVFLCIVSNLRYQIVQGLVEPYMIDGLFSKIEPLAEREGLVGKLFQSLMYVKKLLFVLVRWASGLFGSWINIVGMQVLGLQKVK